MNTIEEHARSVFLGALERSPEQWPAFVSESCGDYAELRARVDQLLRAHQALGSIHDGGAPAATADAPQLACPGALIGPYKLLEQIGEGGMGLVYVAEQQTPVRRKVALKLIKPGMDSRQVIARFEAERQACPPSRRYRLGKFLRKYRRGVLTAAALLAAALVLGAGGGWVLCEQSYPQPPQAMNFRDKLAACPTGTITAPERLTLEKFLRVGKFIDILHAKARLSLRDANTTR